MKALARIRLKSLWPLVLKIDFESFDLENLGFFRKDFEMGCLDLRKNVLHHSSN